MIKGGERFRQDQEKLCGVPRLSVGLVKQLAKTLKRRISFKNGCVSSPSIERRLLFRETMTSGLAMI